MTGEQLIARVLAMPHTHKIITRYANGATHEFTTRNLASAELFADHERHKIGRELIDRETGLTVRVVSVEIHKI